MNHFIMHQECFMKKLASFLAAFLVTASLGAFAASVPPLAANEAFVIMNNLPLWTEKGGTLEFKENLIIGDRVVLLNKAAKFKQDGKERDYVKVRSSTGNEGWVRAPYVVAKAMIAIVAAEKATIYSAPRDVSMTTKYISHMTLVAVLQDGSTPEFAKVVAYDASRDLYYTDPVFVSKTDLTFAEVDVNAFILFTTAKTSKDKGLRANFLKTIEAKYAASVFMAEIRATLAPETAPQKATMAVSGVYTVNDNNVNLRATPDEINGQVVTQLSKGAQVEVLEVTVQSYTIGGLTGQWYRIKEPAGWVFGPFLSAGN
jgi:hypothetical protein